MDDVHHRLDALSVHEDAPAGAAATGNWLWLSNETSGEVEVQLLKTGRDGRGTGQPCAAFKLGPKKHVVVENVTFTSTSPGELRVTGRTPLAAKVELGQAWRVAGNGRQLLKDLVSASHDRVAGDPDQVGRLLGEVFGAAGGRLPLPRAVLDFAMGKMDVAGFCRDRKLAERRLTISGEGGQWELMLDVDDPKALTPVGPIRAQDPRALAEPQLDGDVAPGADDDASATAEKPLVQAAAATEQEEEEEGAAVALPCLAAVEALGDAKLQPAHYGYTVSGTRTDKVTGHVWLLWGQAPPCSRDRARERPATSGTVPRDARYTWELREKRE